MDGGALMYGMGSRALEEQKEKETLEHKLNNLTSTVPCPLALAFSLALPYNTAFAVSRPLSSSPSCPLPFGRPLSFFSLSFLVGRSRAVLRVSQFPNGAGTGWRGGRRRQAVIPKVLAHATGL